MTVINNINVNQEAAKAISALSDAANQDSILHNPLDDVDLEEFVSPLTSLDDALLEKYAKNIRELTEQIDRIESAWPPNAAWGNSNPAWQQAQSRVRHLKHSRDGWEEVKLPIQNKYDVAYKKYLKDNEEAINAQVSVFQEYSELVDKFEKFKTDGLDGLEKVVNSDFERAAKNFTADEVEVIFTADYIIEDQFIGALVCFESYKNATHYEIFKRNLFQAGSDFERVIYLDSENLREETKNYMSYVQNTLGLTQLQENKIFIVLDDIVKQDRIYEYKIGAARVPQRADEVDYDLILESKGLMTSTSISNTSDIDLFTYAGTLLGSKDLAWVLCVANENIPFFGRLPSEVSLRNIIEDPESSGPFSFKVFMPKNVNDILCISKQSISLLGLRLTFLHLVRLLGGLPEEFLSSVEFALDENTHLFSYSAFRENLKSAAPIFQLVLEISETQDVDALEELSKLSVSLPGNAGSENVTTILGLSRVLKFINDVYISVIYSQEKDSFQKIKEIRALVEINREREDPIEEATREMSEHIESQKVIVSDPVAVMYAPLPATKSSKETKSATISTVATKGVKAI